MARARNIKPGFFSNDDLAENNCPLGRILFIGLWCLADYKGDVEWRANRIKVQILPYDNCDIKQLAINLDLSGFVTFYSDGEKVYLRINNFDKHQNPHPNEKKKGSDIPAFTDEMRQLIDLKELAINRDESRQVTERSMTDRADSLIPHPESLILNPEEVSAEPKVSPPTPAVISIPTNKFNSKGEEYPVTENQITEWEQTYPAVNVIQTLKQIRSWNLNNQAKRKTVRGMAAHIDRWLANEQNRGGNSNAASNRPNSPRENDLRRIERESREIFAQCEAEEASERAMGPNGPAVWEQMGQPGGGNFN